MSAGPGEARRPDGRHRLREAWSLRRNLRILFVPPVSNFEHIDGLRGFASQWMIAYHVLFYIGLFLPARFLDSYGELVQSPWLRFVEHGQVGLDIFFAISGFLIAHLLLVEHAQEGRIHFRRFYIRRAFRLLPAYYVALLFYCLTIRVNCDTAWANLLYVNNFVTVTRQCMTWAWSLAIEEQFYIVFPLFLTGLLWMRRFRIAVFFVLFALSLVITTAIVLREGFTLPIHFHPRFHEDPNLYVRYFDTLYDKPHTRYGGILMGVFVAYLYNRTGFFAWFSGLRLASWIGGFTIAVLFVLLIVPDLYFSPWHPFASLAYMSAGRLFFAVMTCGFIVMSLSTTVLGRFLNRILSWRLWYPLAQLSYSVYLLHPTVVIICYVVWLKPRETDFGDLLLYFAIIWTISHALALALYLGLERPMMNLRRHPAVLRWEGERPARS